MAASAATSAPCCSIARPASNIRFPRYTARSISTRRSISRICEIMVRVNSAGPSNHGPWLFLPGHACKLYEIECVGRCFHRQRREPVGDVKRFGCGRDRVHNHKTCRDLVGGALGALHRIGQQQAAKALALPGRVDSETTQNHGRNVYGHVPPHRADRVLIENLAHANRVVADNSLHTGRAYHVGLAGRDLGVLPRSPTQPIIERWLARIECGEVVPGCEWLRPRQSALRARHACGTFLRPEASSCRRSPARLPAYPSNQESA